VRPVLLTALAACLFVTGCASPMVGMAERGDSAALSKELRARLSAHDLSEGDVTDVAHAVASRELRTAKGDAQRARVHDVHACVEPLSSPLGDVVKTRGPGAPYALVSLYEAGELSRGTARDYLADADPLFRQIGVRTLDGEDDRARRRAAFLDAHPMVRRAALRAAIDAQDAGDESALLEAARLDPDAFVRSFAVRALALLEKPSPALANGLADLWEDADDALREDIALAWSLSPIYEQGGRDALRSLLGRGHGPGAISGATAILGGPRAKSDVELADMSVAVLARHIATGGRRDRVLALAVSPLDRPVLLAAVEKAADDADPDVAVQGLRRLLSLDKTRARAQTRLEGYAARKDKTGRDARTALAAAGDLRIQKWVEEDLAATDPSAKVAAARALVLLGRMPRASLLLTDPDPHVRTATSCVFLRK